METEPQIEQRSNRTIWIVVACLFVGLVVFALVGFALVGLGHGEPSIRGRKLTDWIHRMKREPEGSLARREARQAILDIGTDAIPYLLLCLEGKRTLKDEVADFLNSKGYAKTARWLIQAESSRQRPFDAVDGFEVLGTNAISALPQLMELLDRPLDLNAYIPVETCLHCVPDSVAFLGRDGQLQLLKRFPKPDSKYQLEAVNCLYALQRLKQFEPEVLEAVSRFAASSNTHDKEMAMIAIKNLEGSLDLKRSLLDWWFKNLSAVNEGVVLRIFESTPELIPEFRERIVALPPVTHPHAIAIRSRLRALTSADRE